MFRKIMLTTILVVGFSAHSNSNHYGYPQSYYQPERGEGDSHFEFWEAPMNGEVNQCWAYCDESDNNLLYWVGRFKPVKEVLVRNELLSHLRGSVKNVRTYRYYIGKEEITEDHNQKCRKFSKITCKNIEARGDYDRVNDYEHP